MVSRISDDAWHAAFLRIASGQSTETDEAKRLKVHKSTVSRKVKELGPALKTATGATGATKATNATPEGKTAADAKKTPLEIAQEAAKTQPGPAVSQAVAEAQLADVKFCIETIQNYKTAGVYLAAQFSGVPSDDPALPQTARLSEMAKGAIAQNVAWLAPMLRSASTKEVLIGILCIEGFLAFVSVRALAKKYAPADEESVSPSLPDGGGGAAGSKGGGAPPASVSGGNGVAA